MIKTQVYSFKNAINGLRWALRSQLNLRIHLTLSILAILAGWFLKISYFEFLIIFSLIGIGLAIEILNTAIEEAIDAIRKDWSQEVKIAKDASAAAMLIFALSAIVIACIIFIPKILRLLTL